MRNVSMRGGAWVLVAEDGDEDPAICGTPATKPWVTRTDIHVTCPTCKALVAGREPGQPVWGYDPKRLAQAAVALMALIHDDSVPVWDDTDDLLQATAFEIIDRLRGTPERVREQLVAAGMSVALAELMAED